VLAIGLIGSGNKSNNIAEQPATHVVLQDATANAKRAKTCTNLVKDIRRSTDAWKTYQFEQGYGTVEVGDGYYLASFSNKQTLDSVMRCIFTGGRTDNEGVKLVRYIDFRTHKEVATWSPSVGFSVD
jgi:hypothetical protein